MRALIGTLLVVLLAPTSERQTLSSTEEVLKLLTQPGVFLDSAPGTPRLVQIRPVAAMEIRIQVKQDPEPVVAQYPGARAPVRVAAAEPVFYVYKYAQNLFNPKTPAAKVLLVKLMAKGENRELPLGTAQRDGRSPISMQLNAETVPIVVEQLHDDLHRITSASPLAPGEYALVSSMIFVETLDRFVSRASGGPVKLRTPIFDFAVEAP
jgi:hypothetical protein